MESFLGEMIASNYYKRMGEFEMTNKEKYIKAFVTALELKEEQVREGLSYQGVETWDSVGHMGLVAELEETFDIMMDTDDIIDFSSYEKGIEILSRYGIEIEA